MRNSSNRIDWSPLVVSFMERTSGFAGDPFAVMSGLVRALKRSVGFKGGPLRQIERLLERRNIRAIKWCEGVGTDGYIEPMCQTYDGGFHLFLNRESPAVRQRFTVAHELCHTFFYELVPELKFVPHTKDHWEESLCNHGAAELLMPEDDVKEVASQIPEGLCSLEEIAGRFTVSLECLMVRLCSLGLWNCALSVWYPTKDARFMLDRIYGDQKVNWEWLDTTPLSTVWQSGSPRSIHGSTFVHYADECGRGWAKKVNFEVKRRSSNVVALWSTTVPFAKRTREAPLIQYIHTRAVKKNRAAAIK